MYPCWLDSGPICPPFVFQERIVQSFISYKETFKFRAKYHKSQQGLTEEDLWLTYPFWVSPPSSKSELIGQTLESVNLPSTAIESQWGKVEESDIWSIAMSSTFYILRSDFDNLNTILYDPQFVITDYQETWDGAWYTAEWIQVQYYPRLYRWTHLPSIVPAVLSMTGLFGMMMIGGGALIGALIGVGAGVGAGTGIGAGISTSKPREEK